MTDTSAPANPTPEDKAPPAPSLRVLGQYVKDLSFENPGHPPVQTQPNIDLGISPRGALAFKSALQAAALVNGRDYVTPDDLQKYAKPCLAHRLLMRNRHGFDMDWQAAAKTIDEITQNLPTPHRRD